MYRVGVTGIGAICALGKNQADFWDALENGRCGIETIETLDVSGLRFKHAAAVKNYDPAKVFSSKELSLMDRFAQFALIAAEEAVTQAGIEWTEDLREKTAIVTGSSLGGRGSEEAIYRELFDREPLDRKGTHVHPLSIPLSMGNAGASHISIRYGIQGPTYTISTACASSSHAIGQAFGMVRAGLAPMAIAGGSETPLFPASLRAWEAMRVVSKETCRPFSADRSGLILGEGGAMLVLERLDVAVARGAVPLAEIVGFGMSSDAAHLTHPQAGGAARAMLRAIDDCGLGLEQFGYINAHGTATHANDVAETAAIRSVFGALADRLAISSTKSMHGHTLGASGALEAVASVLTLRNGVLPPTANFTRQDPQCDLDVIPNVARRVQVEACLSNSFAFGGLNASLAFRALG